MRAPLIGALPQRLSLRAASRIVEDPQARFAHERVVVVEGSPDQHVAIQGCGTAKGEAGTVSTVSARSALGEAHTRAHAAAGARAGCGVRAGGAPAAGSILLSSAASMVCCQEFVEFGITKPN